MGLNTMPGSQMMLYGRGMGYGVSWASRRPIIRSSPRFAKRLNPD
jgi:hypothetical protein